MNTTALIALWIVANSVQAQPDDCTPQAILPSPFTQPASASGNAAQVAGLGHYGGVTAMDCPDDTLRTSVGHCQPFFEFD